MVSTPRVCLLTETYHPVVGGGETQARALAEGLAARGFRVTVITRRSAPALPKTETYGEVVVHRIPPSGPQHYRKWGLLVTALWTLLALRRDYDLIFVSGFRIAGLAAVLAGRICGKPCILKADSLGEMSGDFFAGGLAKLRLRPSSPLFALFLRLRNAVLRRAAAFVAISTAVADELVASGIRPERIRYVPNSVDLTRFHPIDEEARTDLRRLLGLPLDGHILIFTGRLVSYKGLPLLLQVWKGIHDHYPRSQLLLVGEGGLDIHNCEADLRAYVTEHDLSASVCFTGPASNVHQYLQAADIFVLPTENEAFGISLIEAMACGLAVIGTAVGGVKDILCPRQNGLLIPPGEYQALDEAVRALLNDPTLSATLGRAALASVREKYATPAVVEQYVGLFRELTKIR